MESTGTTQAPVADGRQERQLIAGRYRLASFHRGDDSTEVWRALDESANQVVTLEFLRDRDPVARERFVAGARRLESDPQPSVMRVAGIHDGADGTFIVFEHLVQIPVPVGWLELAVDAPAPSLNTPEAQAAQASSIELGATLPTIATPATSEGPMPDVANEKPADRGLSLLLFALRTRELLLIDMNLLQESAIEFLRVVRSEVEDVRLDPTVITDMRAFVQSADISALTSAPARVAAAAGRLATIRPHVRVPTPHVSRPRPVRAPRVKAVSSPKQRVPRAPRVPGRGLHVRWGRVLTRGLSVGVIAAVLIGLPPELIANVANEVGSTVGQVGSQVSSTISEKLAAAQPAPALARATFELPPLSAYHAAFEAQAPYPTTRPNGTVEWVVALRNTGSVGWYRGIDGAQASLALADGTSAGVQTTPYVGPGQVGWFVVHFPAPSQAGVTNVPLRPRIDGRGSLPDLGIYATVTVSPNP